VNKLPRDGGHDLILSIGQVGFRMKWWGWRTGTRISSWGPVGVMASIVRTSWGAVYGMERMMGRAVTPVRKVLNYASEHFAQELPIRVCADGGG